MHVWNAHQHLYGFCKLHRQCKKDKSSLFKFKRFRKCLIRVQQLATNVWWRQIPRGGKRRQQAQQTERSGKRKEKSKARLNKGQKEPFRHQGQRQEIIRSAHIKLVNTVINSSTLVDPSIHYSFSMRAWLPLAVHSPGCYIKVAMSEESPLECDLRGRLRKRG